MNPVILLALIFILGNPSGKGINLPQIGKFPPPIKPAYIDTFKMELLLDRLHSMTSALEKVNQLNQIQKIPSHKAPSIDQVQDSLDAIKGFLADEKPYKQVDNISNTLSGLKNLGNIEELMSTLSPILSALNNSGKK
jgi:hypothetical protein